MNLKKAKNFNRKEKRNNSVNNLSVANNLSRKSTSGQPTFTKGYPEIEL